MAKFAFRRSTMKPIISVLFILIISNISLLVKSLENHHLIWQNLIFSPATATTTEYQNQSQTNINNPQQKNHQLLTQKKPDTDTDTEADDLLPSRGNPTLIEQIPYIISPRHTLLLNQSPKLRWNQIENATSYHVTIKGPSGYIWQTEVSETEYIYPGKPQLEPGVYYQIIVNANTGESSLDDEMPQQGFEVVNEHKRELIESDIAQLSSNLNDEEKALKIAKIYQKHNLIAEAIATLEALINTNNKNQEVYQTLGNLYEEIGLLNLANNYRKKAIDLATLNNPQKHEQ